MAVAQLLVTIEFLQNINSVDIVHKYWTSINVVLILLDEFIVEFTMNVKKRKYHITILRNYPIIFLKCPFIVFD